MNSDFIYYKEYGEGHPILFLHGFGLDHEALVHFFEPLFGADSPYRRIYVDLPGIGQSPPQWDINNGNDMLKVLSGFIERIFPGQKLSILGQSYGGYLALGLSRQMPEALEGLFLLCPCTIADHSKRRLPVKKAPLSLVDKRQIKNLADYQEFETMGAVLNNEAWRRYEKEILPGLQRGDNAFLNRYQQPQNYAFSFEEDLSALNFAGPAVILAGQEDDCVGYKDAFRFLDTFKNLTFSVLPDAGHNLQLDQPEHLIYFFKNWLRLLHIYGKIKLN